MSRTFRIGTFVLAEGPELVVDLTAGKVTRFTRLTFTDGAISVELDASVRTDSTPHEVDRQSTIAWTPAHATNITGGIELKADRSAFLSFHWPNPLTPRSAGLIFRLTVTRDSGRYKLDFLNQHLQPEFGTGSFQNEHGDWQHFFLGSNPNFRFLTLADWRKQWSNRATPGVTTEMIRTSALLSGRDAALVEDLENKTAIEFAFIFVDAGGGKSRAIAFADLADDTLTVSARALRIEERPGLRPRPLRWKGRLQLRCASVRRAEPAAVSWAVDWLGVPSFASSLREDQLSLRTFWQELARHWPLGLRSLRSRNSLTFVPTDISAGSTIDNGRWVFRYRCHHDSSWRSALATIGRDTRTQLSFELASLLGVDGRPCTFESHVETRVDERPFEPLTNVTESGLATLLGLKLQPSAAPLGEYLVGGMRLPFARLTAGELRVRWAPSRTQLGQPPLDLSLDLTVAAVMPRPGAEDPERGFETENDLLGRERPLVVDLTTAPPAATAVRIAETATAERSRVLEIIVRSAQESEQGGAADVVVIDPAPLLVARVRTAGTKTENEAIVATYRDDGERPPGWELRTETGAMTLLLPPQAIGEEMIKGNLTVVDVDGTRKDVPFRDRPFDFRLSPPARLILDRTDVDTARAAAPWSLRRLLDRREAVVGLKLDSARFELLYGITSQLQNIDGLRVAEQDAFVGRVPIAPALRDRAGDDLRARALYTEGERTHAAAVLAWVRGLFARPAQLPVFRDFANRERLILRDGVTFSFRPTRQTAHPIRIAERANGATQVIAADTNGRRPLRGGADYAFESETIYDAVTGNPQKASPGEPQGQLAGLVFGTLGGSGSQQAAFDEGRSIIISETTQGRLDSLTVVRVGRIAMLWNHARHVIVYERTTRTAPRYKTYQPAHFEALAALRKVKEYIEITQPRRRYPDFPAAIESRPAAGPLTGSAFETVVIPVKSSWGRDVDEGWIMPLRGPLLPGEEEFYPVPKIFLELARAESKGGGAINHLAADPSQLLFFTTTRPGLDADPDRWPAWPDVDFPLTRRAPAPKVRYLPGFDGSKQQPDAARYDYGHGRFTIDVVPPEEAANLLHGRPGEGLEARVRNVSLLRGGAAAVRSAVDELTGADFAGAEARIGDTLAEVAQHLQRVAERSAGGVLTDVEGVRRQTLALLSDARRQVAGLTAAVERGEKMIAAANGAPWVTAQERDVTNARAAAARLSESLRTQLGDSIAAVRDALANNQLTTDDAKARLSSGVEAVCRQAVQRIEGVPFLAAQVFERLDAELARVRSELTAHFERLKTAWRGEVAALAARFGTEEASALEAELFAVMLEGRARLTALATETAAVIKQRLGALFGDAAGGQGAVGRLAAAVDEAVAMATRGIDATLDVIPPFDLDTPDWERLTELLLDALPDVGEAFDTVTAELLDPLREPVKQWTDGIAAGAAAMEKVCGTHAKTLFDNIAQLETVREQVLQDWADGFGKNFGAIADQAKPAVENLLTKIPAAALLQGDFKPLEFVRDELAKNVEALERLAADAAAPLEDLAAEAAAVAQQAGAGLRLVGEQLERAVVKELSGAVAGAERAALELSRALAEGPVTDTLRCTRDWLGYYYDTARDVLDVTSAAAVFNDLGPGVLNSLAAQVPFDRVRDRVLAELGGLDVNKLFPDFAGLKLEHLLSGMTIPAEPGEYDWITMKHGFDRARLTAWSEIAIDKRFDDSPELFTLPPVTLSIAQPRFTATSRIEASADGVRAQRTRAQLAADWIVALNGQPVMTIEQGGLYFDSDGGFRFDFEASDLQLAPALQFVTDALRSFLPPDEGLTLTPLVPGGISVELSLPLPDIGTGAFTLTGITLFAHFDLIVAGGFEVRTGVWLSRPERPFGMAILFLGGGGWFGVDVRYKPPEEFETRVSVGLSAGAFVAVNFGVARGSAGLLFTAGLDFYRNWLQRGSQDLAISIGLLVWGEFSILGIASAYLRMILRIEYRNGEMTGYGTVSVSIKICWCFTLRVNQSIRLPFKSGGGSSRSSSSSKSLPAAAAAVAKAKPAIADAVNAHFANLDV